MIPCERVEKTLKLWTLSKTSFPSTLYIKCLDSLYLSLPVCTCFEENQYVMQYHFVHDFLALFVPFLYLVKSALNKKCPYLRSVRRKQASRKGHGSPKIPSAFLLVTFRSTLNAPNQLRNESRNHLQNGAEMPPKPDPQEGAKEKPKVS